MEREASCLVKGGYLTWRAWQRWLWVVVGLSLIPLLWLAATVILVLMVVEEVVFRVRWRFLPHTVRGEFWLMRK